MNLIILFIIFIAYNYIQFGLLLTLQLITLIIVFLLSNLLIGINPSDTNLQAIRIFTILTIIFLLYFNYSASFITSLILPLSTDRITYFHEFLREQNDKLGLDVTFNTTRELLDLNKLDEFIKNLNINESYIVTLEFIPNIGYYDENAPQLYLSKPILINSFSSVTTISMFINQRIDYMLDYYYIDNAIIKEDLYGVEINYSVIKIFKI